MPKNRRVPVMAQTAAGVAVVAALAFGVGACAAASPSPTPAATADGGRPVVLTTFTVLADMAREVAGDRLRVESLLEPGVEVHGYEPTPGDLARAASADLILDNGLGLEAWFGRFTADLDVPHVVTSAGVEPMAIDGAEESGAVNPHAWMSPREAQRYVAAIAAAFADLDPAHADEYDERARAYGAQLGALHDELVAGVAEVPASARLLVTCEGAFSYLARDAGLDEAYIWPVNAERQATPRRIAAAIDVVRERDVPAVFCESTVSDAPMRQVVESTDAVFGGTLYVDSLSGPDGPVPTYLDLLRHDIDTIVAGLTGRAVSGGGAVIGGTS